MTTIVTRITGGTAKNAPLTNTELDNNFINLNTDNVETADAVSTNTASKVVKRDSSGDFSAGNITLSGTGAIKIPSGTTLQQPGQISQPTPVAGMIRFNSDTSSFEGYKSGAWSSIGGGGAVGGVVVGVTNDVFFENSQVVTASWDITPGKNAMSTGPITINDSKTVTVPAGSRWIIL